MSIPVGLPTMMNHNVTAKTTCQMVLGHYNWQVMSQKQAHFRQQPTQQAGRPAWSNPGQNAGPGRQSGHLGSHGKKCQADYQRYEMWVPRFSVVWRRGCHPVPSVMRRRHYRCKAPWMGHWRVSGGHGCHVDASNHFTGCGCTNGWGLGQHDGPPWLA